MPVFATSAKRSARALPSRAGVQRALTGGRCRARVLACTRISRTGVATGVPFVSLKEGVSRGKSRGSFKPRTSAPNADVLGGIAAQLPGEGGFPWDSAIQGNAHRAKVRTTRTVSRVTVRFHVSRGTEHQGSLGSQTLVFRGRCVFTATQAQPGGGGRPNPSAALSIAVFSGIGNSCSTLRDAPPCWVFGGGDMRDTDLKEAAPGQEPPPRRLYEVAAAESASGLDMSLVAR